MGQGALLKRSLAVRPNHLQRSMPGSCVCVCVCVCWVCVCVLGVWCVCVLGVCVCVCVCWVCVYACNCVSTIFFTTFYNAFIPIQRGLVLSHTIIHQFIYQTHNTPHFQWDIHSPSIPYMVWVQGENNPLSHAGDGPQTLLRQSKGHLQTHKRTYVPVNNAPHTQHTQTHNTHTRPH